MHTLNNLMIHESHLKVEIFPLLMCKRHHSTETIRSVCLLRPQTVEEQ